MRCCVTESHSFNHQKPMLSLPYSNLRLKSHAHRSGSTDRNQALNLRRQMCLMAMTLKCRCAMDSTGNPRKFRKLLFRTSSFKTWYFPNVWGLRQWGDRSVFSYQVAVHRHSRQHRLQFTCLAGSEIVYFIFFPVPFCLAIQTIPVSLIPSTCLIKPLWAPALCLCCLGSAVNSLGNWHIRVCSLSHLPLSTHAEVNMALPLPLHSLSCVTLWTRVPLESHRDLDLGEGRRDARGLRFARSC